MRATRGHGGPRKHIGALQAPRPAPGGGGATPVPSWCRRVDRKTEAASAFLRPVGTATWESLTQAEAQTVSPGGRRGKGGPARGSEVATSLEGGGVSVGTDRATVTLVPSKVSGLQFRSRQRGSRDICFPVVLAELSGTQGCAGPAQRPFCPVEHPKASRHRTCRERRSLWAAARPRCDAAPSSFALILKQMLGACVWEKNSVSFQTAGADVGNAGCSFRPSRC